jgi:hypothetical protein
MVGSVENHTAEKKIRSGPIVEAQRRIGYYCSSSTVRTCILQMGQDEIIFTGIFLQ